MSNSQPNTNRPGTGVLFLRKDAFDAKTKAERKAGVDAPMVSIFTGEMTLPGGNRVQVRANYIERKDRFDVTICEFDTWRELSTFTVPGLAGQSYTDGLMPLDQRKFKFRIIRATKVDAESGTEFNYLRISLPQVAATTTHRHHPVFG